MYEQFFGFNSRPFISTPNVQSYFPGESIHHALSSTRMCIERASGPVVVTGASGSGKSLLIAMLSAHFKSSYSVVNVICGNMRERRDLLQAILFELKLPYKDMSEGELRLSLIDYLKTDKIKVSGMLVLIDDAHDLPIELLDELRVITNLVHDGLPLVSIVLVGQPSLEDHLIETKSESLNQRIATRCYLNSFTQNETFEYISTHIERAGGNGENLFTGDALKSVHQASGGCPRVVNQICDYALVLAASQGSQRITAEIVNDAWRDVQSIPGSIAPSSSFERHDYVQKNSATSIGLPGSYESISSTAGQSEDSIAADDNLMLIEFGQLSDDDDDASASEHVIEISTLESEEEIDSAGQTIQIEPGIVGLDTDTIGSTAASMELTDSDYSQAAVKDDLDRVRGYTDPFGVESFDEIEVVKASFIPDVSEQNLNSLMLSAEQLSILEAIDTDYSPVNQLVSNISPGISEPAVLDATDDADVEQAIEEPIGEDIANEDLRVSSDGLESLEQIANDIKRLQRDMQFSEEQYHSQAAHPDYQNLRDEQPLEELMQDFSSTESAEIEATENATIPMPQIVEESSETEDDQDMMIVTEPHRAERFAAEEPLDETDATSAVSTGNAERMDYMELFQQLRSG